MTKSTTIAYHHFDPSDTEPITHALDLLDKVIDKAKTALTTLGLPLMQVDVVGSQSFEIRKVAKDGAKPDREGGRGVWTLRAPLAATLRCALELYKAKLTEVAEVQTKLGIEEPTDTRAQLDHVARVMKAASEQTEMTLTTAGK